uniref:Anaphase-promoting complex subunit 5 n=1 Tax=Plectus sambesii TaxID=2011161 RepID=A0A914WJQ5_9BILA
MGANEPMTPYRIELEEPFTDLWRLSAQEPLTPYRTAIFVLVQCLDEQNAEKPMTSSQRRDAALLLHELSLQHDLSLARLKEILARRLHFSLPAMEAFVRKIDDHCGDEEVPMRIDDVIRKGDKKPFLTAKSVIGMFIRKLAVTRARQSFTELARSQRQWVEWCRQDEDKETSLSGQDSNDTDVSLLAPRLATQLKFSPTKDRTMYKEPFAANGQISGALSARKARKFIAQQLHLLQLNPEQAMSVEALDVACAAIHENFPDLPEICLLQMVNAIRARNMTAAESSLRDYFDWSSFRMRLLAGGNSSLSDTDGRSLRYAPLLNAKLARLFGLREKALINLTECIQQAQESDDTVCLRHALAELCALDDALEQSGADLPSVLKLALKGSVEEHETDAQQFAAVFRLLRDRADIHRALYHARRGQHCVSLTEALQRTASCSSGSGTTSNEHMLADASQAIACSLQLARGFRDSALASAQQLLRTNVGDQWCTRFATEAHVIAGVNVAYVLASGGRFDEARTIIDDLRRRFTQRNNPLNARHWMLCEVIVGFDRAFLQGDWTTVEACLPTLRALDQTEADMRRAIYLSVRGDTSTAMSLITDRLSSLKRSQDRRNKCRCLLLLGTLQTTAGMLGSARVTFEECKLLSLEASLEQIAACADRRLAYVELMSNGLERADVLLADCGQLIKSRVGPLETGLYHMTRAAYYLKCAIASDAHKNRSLAVVELSSARDSFRTASAPVLEKQALAYAAVALNQLDDAVERNRRSAEFREINEKYTAVVSWTAM